MSTRNKTHCCIPCGYVCGSRSNLTKHYTSKKHINKIHNPDAVIVGGFKCPKCCVCHFTKVFSKKVFYNQRPPKNKKTYL